LGSFEFSTISHIPALIKPCIGSVPMLPNWGKTTGMPPRLGSPAEYCSFCARNNISTPFARFQDRTTVRWARDVRMRELASGNFIFLGSAYSNPWVSLFTKRRNFSVSLDAASRLGVVNNKNPRADESSVYVMKGEDGLPGPTYGVITFLPADAETGNVLIIEGINMEGTEAAGRYLMNGKESDDLR